MYAVFRSGGKQYRAAKGDVLRLEKIDGDEGASEIEPGATAVIGAAVIAFADRLVGGAGEPP